MKLSALILAKSQSTRLPNKNSRDFRGKPMFLHNVEKCAKIFDLVYVTSDDEEMLLQGLRAGGLPILRDESLCGDTPNIPVYQHALKYLGDIDVVVAVQANSPTIKEETIKEVMRLMEEGHEEVMTQHLDGTIYGSVWAVTRKKLENYGDPYKPEPTALVVDESIDIHTEEDLKEAEKQWL